jgi:plastocyanin/uncharacterized membrane protein
MNRNKRIILPLIAFRIGCVCMVVMASNAMPITLAHAGDGSMDNAAPATPHFIRWVGHFHPAMTVFPIAMLLGAAVAELLRMLKGPGWLEGASRWCVIVGAIGAVITAPLGWAFAAGQGGSQLLETHRWLGTAAMTLAVLVLILSEMSHRQIHRAGLRGAFRVALFASAALVGVTGFFGGAMVYGIHEYDWNSPGDQTEAGEHDQHAAPATSRSTGDAANVVIITMTDDMSFKPASITVAAGTTVRWKNTSGDVHTVATDPHAAKSAKDVATPAGAKPFKSGRIKPGEMFEQKFTVPGTYRYVCEPHEEMEMKGEVVVKTGP